MPVAAKQNWKRFQMGGFEGVRARFSVLAKPALKGMAKIVV
jgi:hypothetical protein